MKLREMLSELIEVNRAVLCCLEAQQRQATTPLPEELNLGTAEDTIQRYKALSKQKRAAGQGQKKAA